MNLGVSSVILKFGKLEHLRALQQGTIHMSPWTYFSAAESSVKRDRNEGTHLWCNPGETEIEIAGHRFTKAGGTLSASLKFSDVQTMVFCASEVCRDNCTSSGHIFDPKMLNHGEYLLAITGAKRFGEQLTDALTILLRGKTIEAFEARRVNYFNENTYDGEIGPFRKASRFAFEKEWRLAIRTAVGQALPFRLSIGSIEGESKLMPTQDFKNLVTRNCDGSIILSL